MFTQIYFRRKMQIMVKIPSVLSEDSNNSCKDTEKSKKAPQKLEPLNDWAIIEMQGDLESRVGDVQLEGKFVGDLHFTKAGHVPVLIIGHHILYGKVVKLEKPLVIMEKCQEVSKPHNDAKKSKVTSSGDSLDNSVMEVESGTGDTVYNVRAIIRKKLLFKSRPKPIIANVPKKI